MVLYGEVQVADAELGIAKSQVLGERFAPSLDLGEKFLVAWRCAAFSFLRFGKFVEGTLKYRFGSRRQRARQSRSGSIGVIWRSRHSAGVASRIYVVFDINGGLLGF